MEGKWAFFYFSYSLTHKKAVGYSFIDVPEKEEAEISKIQIETVHFWATYLRFQFGGNYRNI